MTAGAREAPELPPVVDEDSERDPYPLYERLRREAPLHWDEPTRRWYVSRRADVEKLLLDRRLGAHDYPEWIRDLPPDQAAAVVPVEDHLARWPVFSDRPAQVLLRRLLQPALSRRAAAELADWIGRMTRSQAEALPDAAADLLADFARPAALRTVCRLLGVPADDAGRRLVDWSDALIAYLGGSGIDIDRARRARPAVEGLERFVREELLPDARTPVARLLADALRHERVELADIAAMVAQLVTGGIEPTATATCTMMLHAARAPDPAGTALIVGGADGTDGTEGTALLESEAVVEAALRADPPFHIAPREAKCDFDYRGQRIARGQRVALLLASAGHDREAAGPAACPVSAARDPGAASHPDSHLGSNGGSHLAFGQGRHYCLGAPLARAHLQAAWRALSRAGVPRRIDLGAVERGAEFGLTTFLRVPLRAQRP
ncbi:cytochrome P450 [Streptomyces sp. NBC_01190]|uniref:cytochrome P450 n=1 Tax=Streptomyces sp. NBC_01190 TaxID=2903767 RepID=UPI00386E3BFC|nr:cytochrome P450 [Streptomyces sp. NBC_01190]